MRSNLPEVKYGAAHYKYLEQDKINALKISKGWLDVTMISCLQSITGVQWWYNKINCSKNDITKDDFVTRGKFSLDKMDVILMLRNFWQQSFLWKHW